MRRRIHELLCPVSDKLAESVSCRLQGSLTVEAALSFPLFFFAVVAFIMLLELSATDMRLLSAAQYAAVRQAEQQIDHPTLDQGEMAGDMIRSIGSDRIGQSLIAGGAGGISTAGSFFDPVTGIGTAKWTYRLNISLPFIGSHASGGGGELKVKAWNGYHGFGGENPQDIYVYVTENGVVYHRDPGCTHLLLSVRQVAYADLGSCRNQDGGRYTACEKCARGEHDPAVVIIAREGDRYHLDPNCSGLKRTVERIRLSEAGGRRPCSRCSR